MRRSNLFSIVLFVGIYGQTATAFSQDVVIFIRTFIPGDHPSKPGWMLPVPSAPGKTMMPSLGIGQSFGTDSRSFSNKREESSRFGGFVVVSPSAAEPVSAKGTKGITHEYNCTTGDIVCQKTSGEDGFSVETVTTNAGIISFSYSGAASNPCLLSKCVSAMAPSPMPVSARNRRRFSSGLVNDDSGRFME